MSRFKTFVSVLVAFACIAAGAPVHAAYRFSSFRAHPPIHVSRSTGSAPDGLTPAQIKTIYRLPATGGHGTIAIIDAYHDPSIARDLAAFSARFHLSPCTPGNGCLTQHKMTAREKTDGGWSRETALDVEWAHAIAPGAKILLVEAATPSGANLLKAVDYAAARAGVVAVSMSWGGREFPDEVTLDGHFTSASGALFFASAGDNGTGASWPAASSNVIGVGGTTLSLNANGTLKKETAWSGSGGGVSAYESEPAYQAAYDIPRAGGKRAIPDVAFDADPASGFPIVSQGLWQIVGGTSAGAPQWAAIAALGSGAGVGRFYADKASSSHAAYFRDIKSGTNGRCGYFCDARSHYDYVTGLGSPMTTAF